MRNKKIIELACSILLIALSACSGETPGKKTLASNSSGEATTDTTLVSNYISQAEKWMKEVRYDSALYWYTEASKIFEQQEDWEEYVNSYNSMGQCAFRLTDFPAAQSYLNHAIETSRQHLGDQYPEIAKSYHSLSIINLVSGDVTIGKANMEESLNIRLATLPENHPDIAMSYLGMGDLNRFLGELDQALKNYQKALAIQQENSVEEHSDLGTSYKAIGMVLEQKGAYNEAIESYKQALKIYLKVLGEQNPLTAQAYYQLGSVYFEKGDLDRAIEHLNRSLAIRRTLFGEHHLEVSYTYNSLAGCYWKKGDLPRAINYLNQVLSITNALGMGDKMETGKWYINFGILLSESGQHETAIQNMEKGIALLEKFLGTEDLTVAENYGTLALAYSKAGDQDKAIGLGKKAISICSKHYGEQHPVVALYYEGLGIFYQKKKEFEKSFYYLEKALSIRQNVLESLHPDIIQNYNLIATAYADQGKFDQALRSVQQAIALNVPEWEETNPYHNPSLEKRLSDANLLNSLKLKADILLQRFKDQSGDLRDLEASVATYRLAVNLLDLVRNSYRAESSKLMFVENTHEVYEHALQATSLLLRRSPNSQVQNLCFQLAEKSRSAVLLEAMNEAQARQFAGIPDSLLEWERTQRADLAFLEKKLLEEQLKGQAANQAELTSWQDQLFDLNRVHESLLQQLENHYPEYHRLKYQTETATLEEVQDEILDKQSALIEYFVGKDSIFIIAITTDRFEIIPIVKNPAFDQHIFGVREGITQQDFQPYTDAAFALFQTLLLPIKDLIETKDLVIIPDEALSFLPFEALLTALPDITSKIKDYRTLPYLIQQHQISYAYSATLLLETLHRQRSIPKQNYLAFAPVFQEGVTSGTRSAEFISTYQRSEVNSPSSFGALPSSREEVLSIQELFSKKNGFLKRWFGDKNPVFLDANASEEALKTQPLSNYRYLHFATHGFVNTKNPELSGLLLAPDSSRNEDGILHLGEIYNLQLNADLVTLSACETGLGKIARGEGLIGLTRGFIYAGAQNLLVSLWQVNDGSTAGLMTDFYSHMLDGQNKATSLRLAKLNMIDNDPVYAHPQYWASFVLIGK